MRRIQILAILLNSFIAPFQNVILEISHKNFQVDFQKQVLVVHVRVITASIFPRAEAAKQGNISGVTD